MIEGDLKKLRLSAPADSARERILRLSRDARNSHRFGRWIRHGVFAAVALAVAVGILMETGRPVGALVLEKPVADRPVELEWAPDLVTCFRRELAPAPSGRMEMLPWQP